MKFVKLQKFAKNTALILGLAAVTAFSANAQNSNTGTTTANRSNTTTSTAANTGGTTAANTTAANTPARTESTATPRATATMTATATPRTEVQTVVQKENGFPWGWLGLLGLLGLIPKKRSVEVTGVRETTRETRTTTDDRNNRT